MRVYRLTAALALGAASVLAFAPVGGFPLIWFTLAGLYTLLSFEQRPRAAAWLGAAFGGGLFLAGVSWVYVSLSIFGGLPAAIAALATILFCMFLALYPAVVAALFVRLAPTGWWQRGALFASLWTITEWLRGWVFTGFPWLAIGYSQTPPSPPAGLAPVLGVFGISWATAFLAAMLAETWRRSSPKPGTVKFVAAPRNWLPLVLALIVLAGSQALRHITWTSPTGSPLSVALLQGNVPQDIKWRPETFNKSLLTYYRLALENPAQLTVFPETALPAFLSSVPDEYLTALQKLAGREQGDMLIGVPFDTRHGYANGAISLGHSPPQRYSKSHLVPFGEFVPPGFGWFLAMANIPMSNFTPGAHDQKPLQIAGQQVAVNICYEDAFGEEIIRALPEANLLVNMSNVAWFGDSLAPAQHLQIARLRALETGRVMLRATNTGMTAIIDIDGSVVSALPPFTRAALRSEVQPYQGSTPYVRWGNWPIIVLAFGLIAIVGRRKAVS